MKKAISYCSVSCILLTITIGIAAVGDTTRAVFLAPDPAPVPANGSGEYIPGGRNIEADNYVHTDGYPSFPDRVRFLGTISGSWHEMGVQFGRRSGDETRCVSDIWWLESCKKYGKAETVKAIRLYEAQIAALDPDLIEYMKGIAEGAAPWLDQSTYAARNNSYYATNYQRVLACNIYDEWVMMHPRAFPDGSSTFGGSVAPSFPARVSMCSGFAARGKATIGGKVIVAHNRHAAYDPRAYEQAYVIKPPAGHTCWLLTNSPQVSANQVVNDAGLSVSLFAGGSTNPRSLKYKGQSHVAEGFGVPWFSLLLYVGTHAGNSKEAIQMLTIGTEQYRAKAGRNSLLRGGGWLFMVADPSVLAVVETTSDRYAVRYPGEYTGANLSDKDYIACTNNSLAGFSYDRDNALTDVPMTLFGDEFQYDTDGQATGLDGRGVRFWTMMWDLRHHYGRIDRYRAQQILGSLFANDKTTGEQLQAAQDGQGVWRLWGTVRPSNAAAGASTLAAGTDDAKIAVLEAGRSRIYWTMGSPTHWQGAWDEYRFKAPDKNEP